MLNEKGLFTFDTVDERGRVLIDGVDERGYTVFSTPTATPKYYLQMDGVYDYLATPNLISGITDIYMEVALKDTSGTLWNAKNGQDKPSIAWNGTSFDSVYGTTNLTTTETGNTNPAYGILIPKNKRVTVHTWESTAMTISTFNFGRTAWSNSGYLAMDIYDIKLYRGATLFAHYDMSTGTAQDQSGNGNHAILYGGTWVEDSGTTPIGVDIVYDYLLKQTIFNNVSKDYSMKGSIYNDTLNNLSLNQILFKDIDNKYIMNNKIFSDMETSVSIFNRIFKDSSNNFSMIQTFFNDESLIYNFAMKVVIYNNIVKDFSTKQRSYIDSQINPVLLQKLYNPKTNNFNIRNIIYKDTINSYNFNNRLYINNSNNFNVNNRIYNPYSKDSLIKNVIFKDVITNPTILNRLYSNKQNNYSMLNRFYVENVSLATFRNIIFKNIVEDIPMQIILIAQGNYYEIIYFKANLDTSPIAFKTTLPIDIIQFKAGLGENKLTFNDVIRMIYNFKSKL